VVTYQDGEPQLVVRGRWSVNLDSGCHNQPAATSLSRPWQRSTFHWSL